MSLFYGYENKHESDVTGKLSTTGGDMTGDINMGSHHIITSVDPTENAHLARKKYVDDKVASSRGGTSAFLSKTGGTMTGNISMGNNRITTTVNPTGVKDLARKKYVDDQDARRLSITGGTMSGNIIMGNNKITTTVNATGDKDLARKKYVDDRDNENLSLTGGNMTGDINMGNHKIISTYHQPTHETHIITRKYVDVKFNTFWFQFFKFYTTVYEMKDDVSYMIYGSSNNRIRAVYNQTESENLDVNLEATNGQNNRPFYKNTNTMYFKNENNFFEVAININSPAVSSKLGTSVGSSNLNPSGYSSNLKDRVHIFIIYEM